jgi:phytoene synthase
MTLRPWQRVPNTPMKPANDDLQGCLALMRGGSKTFFAASRVLPGRVRAPAAALYAFCRVADDAIDLSDDHDAALADLRRRLDAVYAGAPGEALADRALACVVRSARIPRALLDALLEGFAWDNAGRHYETIEDVHDYGARVAGTVGAMMSLVMGTRGERALARACELGVAMQLTNIARDVGEDARNGRLYLPRQWLREERIDPEAWLAAPVFNAGIARVVKRLLYEADRLYRRAEAGVAELPRDCRPAIQAARLVYAEIGREVEAAGLDSVSRRAVVPGRRKLVLMARATSSVLRAPAHALDAPPLPAIAYLVEAAASNDLPARTFYDRTVRVVDLLERLEMRRRVEGGTPQRWAAGG